MGISNVNANNVAGYSSVCKNSSPISSGPSSFLGGLQRETAKLTARQEAAVQRSMMMKMGIEGDPVGLLKREETLWV